MPQINGLLICSKRFPLFKYINHHALFTLIAQGYSIDEVKEFLEENLGWQFCGIIADDLDKKNFSRNQ